MTHPESYRPVISQECQRYLLALEDSLEIICQKEIHKEHLERVQIIHNILKSCTSLFLECFVLNTLEYTVNLQEINEQHQLQQSYDLPENHIHNFTSAFRGFITKINSSFLCKSVLPTFGATNSLARFFLFLEGLKRIFKYFEATSSTIETYLSWIDHATEIAASYSSVEIELDEDEELTEEKVNLIIEQQKQELYTDIRVKAYALLKTFDSDPKKISEFLDDIDALLEALPAFLLLIADLYASMEPDSFECLFNTFTNKNYTAPTYQGTKFKKLQQLSALSCQQAKESMDNPKGLLYNINEIFNEAKNSYLDKLARDILTTLSFLSDKRMQCLFIEQFESGKVWSQSLE